MWQFSVDEFRSKAVQLGIMFLSSCCKSTRDVSTSLQKTVETSLQKTQRSVGSGIQKTQKTVETGIQKTVETLNVEPNIDFDYPRVETHAFKSEDTQDTWFGKHFAASKEGQPPDYSGFRPLVDGTDALATRLLMARKAEKSIDAQYYLIKDDQVGRIFIYNLMQAADRGVRVRLLIDDMFMTKQFNVGMAALCRHPQFEIRIFNPFQRSEITGKSLQGTVRDFRRINRRMHNKTFTIDNQITIIGGRNIADEYFGANTLGNFHDEDVLAIGPIVQDVSDTFDMYWNHSTALPAPAFLKHVEDAKKERDKLRDAFAAYMSDIADSKYSEAVRAKISDYLSTEDDIFQWAPYQLVVDSPDKGIPSLANQAASITTPLLESLKKAKKHIIVVSPYFVPDRHDVQRLIALRKTGVDVIIVTNSLAANNMFMVHGGYAPVRKPLLQAGIKIYEVRADSKVLGSEYIDTSHAVTTLHTKVFVVDENEAFIGSFNFDPRSIKLNTECGVIIRDTTIASDVASRINSILPNQCYKVYLNSKGRLRWKTTLDDGTEVVKTNEPDTTVSQRGLGLFARAVPKSQL